MEKQILFLFAISSVLLFGYSWWTSLFKGFKEGEANSKSSEISSSQAAGYCLWQATDQWVDYMLYPAMLSWLGFVNGTISMIGITFAFNTTYTITNNKTVEDWTLMSWFTHLRDSDSRIWSMRYVRLIKKRRFLWLRTVFRRITFIPMRRKRILKDKILRRISKFLRRFLIFLLAQVRKILRIKRWGNVCGYLYFTLKEDSFHAINFLYHKRVDFGNGKVVGLYLMSHMLSNLFWAPVAGLISVMVEWIIQTLT